MTRLLTLALRGYLLLGAVLIVVVAFRPDLIAGLPGAIQVLLIASCVIGAVISSSQATPGRYLYAGLTEVYPAGVGSRDTAVGLVRKASTSIQLVDTYWGEIDSFRDAITDALTSAPACKVQILLATRDGCLAKIRDAANPGLLSVAANVDAAVHRVQGLKAHLDTVAPGLSSRIDLRFFDAIVPGPFLIIDKKQLMAGTFLQSAGSTSTLTLQFRRTFLAGSRRIIDSYVHTFELLWNKATV